MNRTPEVEYLNCTQNTWGGSNACPTVAVHVALYLLYSEAPRRESLVQVMQDAVEKHWLSAEERCCHLGQACTRCRQQAHGEDVCLGHHGRVEASVRVWNRARALGMDALHNYMYIDQDLETSGIMLADESMYDSVPQEYWDMGMVRGIRPALQRCLEKVKQLDPCRARSFVICRSMRTMVGCIRKDRKGSLRIDLFDSHECFFSSVSRPVSGRNSAAWVVCYTLDQAIHFLHELFPPATSARGLETYARSQVGGENENMPTSLVAFPESFFTFTVFRPLHDTPAQAEQAFRQAARAGTPFHSTLYPHRAPGPVDEQSTSK